MIICNSEPNRIRSLFTRDALGITAYVSSRELEAEYTHRPEEFKVEFKKCLDEHVPSHIIFDHLKRFVHIMDESFADLNLLQSGLRLYSAQRAQLESRGGDISKDYYEFGPIVMRALYHFGLLNPAIEVLYFWPILFNTHTQTQFFSFPNLIVFRRSATGTAFQTNHNF